MENAAWKGEGISDQCCSTTATEGSPTDGADVNNEGFSFVSTVTLPSSC
jgi:hypothetical protein